MQGIKIKKIVEISKQKLGTVQSNIGRLKDKGFTKSWNSNEINRILITKEQQASLFGYLDN